MTRPPSGPGTLIVSTQAYEPRTIGPHDARPGPAPPLRGSFLAAPPNPAPGRNGQAKGQGQIAAQPHAARPARNGDVRACPRARSASAEAYISSQSHRWHLYSGRLRYRGVSHSVTRTPLCSTQDPPGWIGPRHPAGANEHISGQYGRAALPLNVSRPGPIVFASVTLAWTAGPEPPRVRRSCTSYRHGLEPERVVVVVGRLDSLTRGVAQVAAKRLARPAWRYACQGRFGYPGRRCDLLVAVPPGAVRPRKRSEGDTASGTHTERHGRAVGLRRAIRVRA